MITVPASSYLFLPAPRQFNPAFILDLTELFIARAKFPHRFFNDNVRQKKKSFYFMHLAITSGEAIETTIKIFKIKNYRPAIFLVSVNVMCYLFVVNQLHPTTF